MKNKHKTILLSILKNADGIMSSDKKISEEATLKAFNESIKANNDYNKSKRT